MSHRIVFAVLLLVALDPRAASAESFNTEFFSIHMTYFTGEPEHFGEIFEQDTERLSREDRLEHADVIATGGFVANANGTLLEAATEVGALAYIDYDAGVYWDTLWVSGTSFATTTDVLTIEGPLGATGAIKFNYLVEGTLYHELDYGPGTFTGGGYIIDNMIAAGHLTFSIQESLAQDAQTPFNEIFKPESDDTNPRLPRHNEDVPETLGSTGDFLFQFNTPFRITYELVATVTSRQPTSTQGSSSGSGAPASATRRRSSALRSSTAPGSRFRARRSIRPRGCSIRSSRNRRRSCYSRSARRGSPPRAAGKTALNRPRRAQPRARRANARRASRRSRAPDLRRCAWSCRGSARSPHSCHRAAARRQPLARTR